MKFDAAHEILEGIPFISKTQAKSLYDFILARKPRRCLELGFAHGVSVCYMAAALDEIGEGHIDAVDLTMGQEWQDPAIETLLEQMGLSHLVTVVREELSYTWFLKKKIEEQTKDVRCEPLYDFCYIDGPKNWTVDGAAFFMVDKLLRKDGFILFDDMNWKYSEASEWSAQKLEECGILVSRMSEDEKAEPHVPAIFRLLVMQHPDYSNFEIVDNNWGWAQKTRASETKLSIKETAPFGTALKRRLRRVLPG
jgi:predicted O-methyltransferase YrrM